MKRHVIRGLVMLGLFAAAAVTVSAQPPATDAVEVRNRKDGTTKTHNGLLKVTPAGFQVFGGEKLEKASEAFSPDDIVRVAIGELPGIERASINAITTKENKKGATSKDAAEARDEYKKLIKGGLPDRTKRYLEFKVNSINHKLLDELDGKEWQEKADKAISDWKGFIADYKPAFGWEMWPAVRALTRLQIERNKYDDAATSWEKIRTAPELPPDAKLEAALQEIDLRIRSKTYPNASVLAEELLKTAPPGARKERLAIYLLASRAGSDAKYVEGVDKIKAEMEKTKDASVHATGYAMMGELYLAGGKFRDAMWMFLWVETVVNQDKDEVFKAVSRLAELFEKAPAEEDPNKKPLADEEQAKKYREKLKRFRTAL